MGWTIEYTETARDQLRGLDKPIARRIVDYMGGRVASLDDPRSRGRALAGRLGGLWRYRVGDYRMICELRDDALRVLVVRIAPRAGFRPAHSMPLGWAIMAVPEVGTRGGG